MKTTVNETIDIIRDTEEELRGINIEDIDSCVYLSSSLDLDIYAMLYKNNVKVVATRNKKIVTRKDYGSRSYDN